ncbi:MAG TPA: 4Fe-4S dicluster domain-containing protein, partial [Candidatus Elarobacter sp.]|nr:4Fe-4S dicluster domain-containing protein [Candidatus Elarobacter sp.]
GCGYCVPSCPFGVVAVQPDSGVAQKCTLCYDRQKDGLEPACAKSCPTDSITFGPVDELRAKAKARVAALQEQGREAHLYGVDGEETRDVGPLNAFFLIPDRPEVFNLPPKPVLPSKFQPEAYAVGLLAAMSMAVVGISVFRGFREEPA